MIDWLVATNGGIVPLILRLTLAVVMFPHGAQKTLGWFGGYGFRPPWRTSRSLASRRLLHSLP